MTPLNIENSDNKFDVNGVLRFINTRILVKNKKKVNIDHIILVISACVFILAFPLAAMLIEIPRIPEWKNYKEYPCNLVNITKIPIEFGYYEHPINSDKWKINPCDRNVDIHCETLIMSGQTGICCSNIQRDFNSGRGHDIRNVLSSVEYTNAWIGNMTCILEGIEMHSKQIKCDIFDDDCVNFWFQPTIYEGCRYNNGDYKAYDECAQPPRLTPVGIVMIIFSGIMGIYGIMMILSFGT